MEKRKTEVEGEKKRERVCACVSASSGVSACLCGGEKERGSLISK